VHQLYFRIVNAKQLPVRRTINMKTGLFATLSFLLSTCKETLAASCNGYPVANITESCCGASCVDECWQGDVHHSMCGDIREVNIQQPFIARTRAPPTATIKLNLHEPVVGKIKLCARNLRTSTATCVLGSSSIVVACCTAGTFDDSSPYSVSTHHVLPLTLCHSCTQTISGARP
jgi:hypothetical protein